MTAARGLLHSEFVRHGALIFASTTLVNLCNYAFHFVMSRTLGVTGYGALSSLLAALMLASIPATVAASTIAKYAATLSAVNDRGGLRSLAQRVVTYGALAAAIACGAGFLASVPLASYLNLSDPTPVVLVTLIASLQFLSFAVRGILQGVQDFRRFAVATVSEVSGKLVLGAALVGLGFGLRGALIGYVAASCASLAYTLCAVRVRVPARPLAIAPAGLLRTTGAIAVSTAALSSLGFTDVILVKHFFDPRTAGLYGAISLAGKAILFVVSFVPTIVLPKAADRAARGASAIPLLLQAAGALVAFAVVALACISFFPSLTISLMAGPAFAAAAPYLLPYGSAMVLLAATTIVVSYKTGLHQFDFAAPLLTIAVGEIVAMQILHRTLSDVVSIVLIGHGIAFASVLYRIGVVRRPERVVVPPPVADELYAEP